MGRPGTPGQPLPAGFSRKIQRQTFPRMWLWTWSLAGPAVGAGVLWLLPMSLQSEALSQSAIKYLLFPTQLSSVAGPGRGDHRAGDRELSVVNGHLRGVT